MQTEHRARLDEVYGRRVAKPLTPIQKLRVEQNAETSKLGERHHAEAQRLEVKLLEPGHDRARQLHDTGDDDRKASREQLARHELRQKHRGERDDLAAKHQDARDRLRVARQSGWEDSDNQDEKPGVAASA